MNFEVVEIWAFEDLHTVVARGLCVYTAVGIRLAGIGPVVQLESKIPISQLQVDPVICSQ